MLEQSSLALRGYWVPSENVCPTPLSDYLFFQAVIRAHEFFKVIISTNIFQSATYREFNRGEDIIHPF